MRMKVAVVVVLGILAALGATTPAHAVDLFTTPGEHLQNGRRWRTECSSYSSTITRCRTDIWATQVVLDAGQYRMRTGWFFNNLTYPASPRAAWMTNNLGRNATWNVDGRDWKTECDTLQTGYNNCRSWIWGTYTAATTANGRTAYSQKSGWIFNNIVRFSTDYYLRVSGTGDRSMALPAGLSELYVRAVHRGSAEFAVFGLDTDGFGSDGEIACTGACTSADAFGLLSESPAALDVLADGRWELVVRPLSTAPKLAAGMAGTNSDVFWAFGPASTRRLTTTGATSTSAIDINPHDLADYVEIADVDGDYAGPLSVQPGPRLVWLHTDGTWRIS